MRKCGPRQEGGQEKSGGAPREERREGGKRSRKGKSAEWRKRVPAPVSRQNKKREEGEVGSGKLKTILQVTPDSGCLEVSRSRVQMRQQSPPAHGGVGVKVAASDAASLARQL